MKSAVAGGSSTLSLSPQLHPGNWPAPITMRSGAYAYHRGGQPYLDYESGLLSVTLGHAHPEVVHAVANAARGWITEEEAVARTVRWRCGYPQGKVRFTATGTHACEGAVRIARAVTGRSQVLSIGYHGWSDAVLTAAPGWGVPAQTRKLTHTVPWGDLKAAELHCFGIDYATGREEPDIGGKNLACIIVEPVTLELPPAGYLEGLRHLADRFGCLLIFDECITGGRYSGFTFGNTPDLRVPIADRPPLPDLTVLSKGLANGYPLGAIVGSAEVMACFDHDFQPEWVAGPGNNHRGPVYVSGTWSAPNVSLAAAEATLRVWEREKPYDDVERYGDTLATELRTEAEAGDGFYIRIRGQPYRYAVDVAQGPLDGDQRKAPTDYVATTLLKQYLVDEGVLLGTGLNLTLAHCTDGVYDRTVEAWKTAVLRWLNVEPGARAGALTNGHVCVPPYRQS